MNDDTRQKHGCITFLDEKDNDSNYTRLNEHLYIRHQAT